MSVNDLSDAIEHIARSSLLEAKAIRVCEFHHDSTINACNPDAEKLAYAIATNMLKRDGLIDFRKDVMDAIKSELEMAHDECPQCARFIDK